MSTPQAIAGALSTCPFCGGRARHDIREHTVFCVDCSSCALIEHWNKRSQSARIAVLESLVRDCEEEFVAAGKRVDSFILRQIRAALAQKGA